MIAGPLAPSDEARELGIRLRDYRVARGKSVADIATAAAVARTYVYDCEAGRKFPSRQLIERLGDAELLALYNELARRRTWRSRKPRSIFAAALVRQLSEGFPCEEPPGVTPAASLAGEMRRTTFRGHHESIDQAIRLVAAATREDPDTIIIHIPALTRNPVPEWVKAVKQAIDCGWYVVQLLQNNESADAQVSLVRDLLNYVGLEGQYRPVVLEPRFSGSRDSPVSAFLIVRGVGALQFLLRDPETIDGALLLPWSEDDADSKEACEILFDGAMFLTYTGKELLSIHTASEGTGKRDEPVPGKIVHDSALTEAVVQPGDRVLVKSGLLVSTMPPHVAERQAARWKKEVGNPHVANYIDILLRNRLRRWSALRSNNQYISRDICTKSAILAYLSDDYGTEKWSYTSDPLYSGRYLELEDRVEHVLGVISLLKDRECKYELGLAENPGSLPIPVGNSYWLATQSAVFFVSFSRRAHDLALYGSIRDEATIGAFYDLFELVWESLPEQERDRDFVIAWLEEQVKRQ